MGLEISSEAVKSAIARYGDYYICGDLYKFSKSHAGLFDVVLLTEVIEHVPDVTSFLSAISNLLVKGGELVVTTPNKSSYPHSILWHTEAPPIHLWWLSELSMKTLASKIGHSIKIIDFTEYNRSHFQSIALNLKNNSPYYGHTLTQSGQLISMKQNKIIQHIKISLKKVRFDKIINAARSIKINYINRNIKRRHTMCAIFTKN
jgi:SAM-dependent methyltransferase